MRSSLLLAAFVFTVPAGALAQTTCYSPSDCTGMMHCTSLDDGIVPGRCTTDARIINKTPPKVIKPPPAAPKTSSSSSAPMTITPAQQEAMLKSLASTMKSMMDSMNSMMNGMVKSIGCMFGACKKA